jgi:hypothetical protein
LADKAPAGTLTDVGTETAALLLPTVSTGAPDGIAFENPAVQVSVLPETRSLVLQFSELKLGGARSVNANFWEEPLRLAMSWAEVSAPTVPSVTANPAEFAPAATFNDAGTVRLVSLAAMATLTPPAGAA